MATIVDLHDLTHDQIHQAVQEGAIALLPVGAIEQHGHMAVGTDCFTCVHMTQAIAASLFTLPEAPPYIIKLPGLPFGASEHHTAYVGTISIGGMLLTQVLNQILRELYRSGIRLVCIVNGHGGNENPIEWAIKDAASFCPGLCVHHHALHYLVHSGKWSKMHPGKEIPLSVTLSDKLCQEVGECEVSHADAAEASWLGVLRPKLLQATQQHMDRLGLDPIPDMTEISGIRKPEEWLRRMAAGNGGKGDPRRATPESVQLTAQIMQKAAQQTADDLVKMWQEMHPSNS